MEHPEDVLQFEPREEPVKRLCALMEQMIPETVLQPNLHSLKELAQLLLDEAETRGIVNVYLDDEHEDESIEQSIQALEDADYYVFDDDDTILIYGLEDSKKLFAAD